MYVHWWFNHPIITWTMLWYIIDQMTTVWCIIDEWTMLRYIIDQKTTLWCIIDEWTMLRCIIDQKTTVSCIISVCRMCFWHAACSSVLSPCIAYWTCSKQWPCVLNICCALCLLCVHHSIVLSRELFMPYLCAFMLNISCALQWHEFFLFIWYSLYTEQ